MTWSGSVPASSTRTFAASAPASSTKTFSGITATDVGRQFNTVGPFNTGGYTDFVLSVDESHPIYLSESAPYITVQEVMGQL